jgi:DNA mismatch endonuclease (patch repair protein)
LPGKPDIVLTRFKAVVFVHGCFWHRHESCKNSTMPSTRHAFWAEKFAGNVRRDAQNRADLEKIGWAVHIVWECDLKRNPERVANKLVMTLRRR